MDAKQIILQMKYARIIKGIAEQLGISLEEAMDKFYDFPNDSEWRCRPTLP